MGLLGLIFLIERGKWGVKWLKIAEYGLFWGLLVKNLKFFKKFLKKWLKTLDIRLGGGHNRRVRWYCAGMNTLTYLNI